MKSVETFEGTLKTVKDEIAKIDETYDLYSLGEAEGKVVRALQLLEVQISEIGSELYAVVRQRRADISQGKVVKAEEKVAKTAAKKTVKKTGKK